MAGENSRRYWLYFGVVGVVCLLLVLLILSLLGNYEIIEKGRLLDYTKGVIYKVRFYGQYTVLIEPERRLGQDVFNSFLLVGIGFISLTYAFIIAQLKCQGTKQKIFMFMTMFVGMIYLAIDEFFGVHESIGHNMQFLANLPFIERPDDVIVMSYLFPVVLFFLYFRKELLVCRAAIPPLACVVIFFLLSAISDMFTFQFEEIFELGASICLVLTILLVGSTHLQKIVGRSP